MNRQKDLTLIALLFFFAIICILPPIAISTLFPYTTLFRSKRTMADMRTIATAWEARATDVNRYNAAGLTLDRRSTSLNYSNTVISYAVFCLKQSKDGWGTNGGFGVDQPWGDTSKPAHVYAI